MLLSNKCLLLVSLMAGLAFASACGSKNTGSNASPNSPAAANGDLTKGEQPFAAKEPDVYQTEVYYTVGGATIKNFVARSGDKRRVDTYVDDKLSVTELIKDNNRYVIDHVRKIYYVEPPNDKGPKVVNPAAIAFFQNTQHHEFDEVGRGDGTITYRAKKQQGDPEQDVVVTIDQKTGLMVHQEVKAPDPKQSLIFDLKNVKLDAPDDLFQLPAGYKQVAKDQFKPPERNANAKSPTPPTENPHAGNNGGIDIKKCHE